MNRTIIEKMTFGYRFDREREVISLLLICYFIIFLFGFIVVLLHAQAEELVPVSYRYHSIILLSPYHHLADQDQVIYAARV